MPNVSGVVVIATEKLGRLIEAADVLRVQLDEEHAAFLVEQVAGHHGCAAGCAVCGDD